MDPSLLLLSPPYTHAVTHTIYFYFFNIIAYYTDVYLIVFTRFSFNIFLNNIFYFLLTFPHSPYFLLFLLEFFVARIHPPFSPFHQTASGFAKSCYIMLWGNLTFFSVFNRLRTLRTLKRMPKLFPSRNPHLS